MYVYLQIIEELNNIQGEPDDIDAAVVLMNKLLCMLLDNATRDGCLDSLAHSIKLYVFAVL